MCKYITHNDDSDDHLTKNAVGICLVPISFRLQLQCTWTSTVPKTHLMRLEQGVFRMRIETITSGVDETFRIVLRIFKSQNWWEGLLVAVLCEAWVA